MTILKSMLPILVHLLRIFEKKGKKEEECRHWCIGADMGRCLFLQQKLYEIYDRNYCTSTRKSTKIPQFLGFLGTIRYQEPTGSGTGLLCSYPNLWFLLGIYHLGTTSLLGRNYAGRSYGISIEIHSEHTFIPVLVHYNSSYNTWYLML